MQDAATALIVFLAAAYLVWKLGWAGRPRSRRRPDVPLDRLRRRR